MTIGVLLLKTTIKAIKMMQKDCVQSSLQKGGFIDKQLNRN